MDYLTEGFEDMELSTQLVIKEAIARGARVEVLDRGDNFILVEKGNRRECLKQATRTSADSYISALAMENKEVSKALMSRAGIRVPSGSLCVDLASALAAAAQFRGRALVVKPRSTNFGDAVSMLGEGWTMDEAATAVEAALALDKAVILEEFVEGLEYRFLVIGGVVRAVLHRRPANVQGDGHSTIFELVDAKNAHPFRGEGYRSPLEKICLGETELSLIAEAGLEAGSVPEKGRRVFLRKNSNISTGGDSIDFTDAMPDFYKRIAEKAAAALGANISGVDMIIRDIASASKNPAYAIIELNYNPALHIHDFPFEGENRRVERYLLDLIGIENGGHS